MLCLSRLNCFWFSDLVFVTFFVAKQSGSAEIDIGTSQAVKDSTKISMTKNVFDGRVELPLPQRKRPVLNEILWMFGKILDFLNSKLVISPMRRQTCLR